MEEGRCESGQRRLLVINVPKRLDPVKEEPKLTPGQMSGYRALRGS